MTLFSDNASPKRSPIPSFKVRYDKLTLPRAVGHENFDAEDLFEPRINIRLGSHYLAELSERFDGRLSAAIASYNAGPEAVSAWLEARGELEDDEWVESIPYEQTRSYVKRVLRSVQAYRLLY